jgi:hypothetical protein
MGSMVLIFAVEGLADLNVFLMVLEYKTFIETMDIFSIDDSIEFFAESQRLVCNSVILEIRSFTKNTKVEKKRRRISEIISKA